MTDFNFSDFHFSEADVKKAHDLTGRPKTSAALESGRRKAAAPSADALKKGAAGDGKEDFSTRDGDGGGDPAGKKDQPGVSHGGLGKHNQSDSRKSGKYGADHVSGKVPRRHTAARRGSATGKFPSGGTGRRNRRFPTVLCR